MRAGLEKPRDHGEDEGRRKANPQKMRKEGSQAQAAITECPAISHRGESRQAGIRLALPLQ